MRISYNWLKDFVAFEATPRELAERLTMVGLAVDTIEPVGDDFALELDLTSNRPDALSHLGVAREVAAIYRQPIAHPELDGAIETASNDKPVQEFTSVEILNPTLCPRYVARVVHGVKIGPSPDWLVKRLEAVGQRSVNNIADITNYVMFELGQPTHAFDFNRLAGRRIIVRNAHEGERLVTLNGVDHALTPEILVIADAEGAVALGGVMGGLGSEITSETVDVLLESAYFERTGVRHTSRQLNLPTEASYRFERGIDYNLQAIAATRCVQLIQRLAGGTISPGIIDVYPRPIEPNPIKLRYRRIEELTGLLITPKEVERILASLEFQVEPLLHSDEWLVLAPTCRTDINFEEDLIEEVARLYGYEKIGTTQPLWTGSGAFLPGEAMRRAARNTLSMLGLNEAISFSFYDSNKDKLFQDRGAQPVGLLNPILENLDQMRTSLLPGLLDAVVHNLNHGTRNINLFELGKCFNLAVEVLHEREMLALAMTGQANEADWQRQNEMVDFYTIKGVVESLFDELGFTDYQFGRADVPYLHPGQSARIYLADQGERASFGVFGQLHPQIAQTFKLKQPVFVAEIDFFQLLERQPVAARFAALPRFPASTRDLSAVFPRQLALSEILAGIEGLEIPQLESVRLFDVYSGKNLAADRISLSFSFRFREQQRTLTEEEVSGWFDQITTYLKQQFGAELRQ